MKDAKSVTAFSPCLRVGLNDVTQMAWLPSQFQNGGLPSRSFKKNFVSISGTSEAKTLVSGKGECLFAGDEVKNVSFLVTL